MADSHADLRERILAAIRRLTDVHGKPPGKGVFYRESGFTTYDVLRFWSSLNDAIVQAGYEPNKRTVSLPEDALLEVLASAVREIGAFPTAARFRHFLLKHPGSPSHTTFSGRYRTVAAMFEHLSQWVANHDGYRDVRAILSASSAPKVKALTAAASSLPNISKSQAFTLSDSYVPPVIAALPQLATGDSAMVATLHTLGQHEEVEFEHRVGVAFALLGLDVKRLGQGTGRKADGIAKNVRGHWAVIYDAKVRRNGFHLDTEDRKFKEYIERHGSELRNEGIERFYFAVVSSSFRESDLGSARALVRATNAKACLFIEANVLVHWVEQHLKHAAGYLTDDLEARLDTTGIARK